VAYAVCNWDEIFAIDIAAGKLLRLYRTCEFQQQWLTPMLHGAQPPSLIAQAVATPDGKYLLVRDHARIARLRIDRGELHYDGGTPVIAPQSSGLYVSPDSQRVVLTVPWGGVKLPDFPATLSTVYVYRVEGLSKPLAPLDLGGPLGGLAFGGSGEVIFAQDSTHDLVVFESTGKRRGEIQLGGGRQFTRNMLAYPRGDRVLVATDKALTWVSLTKP
jgi:hypothetical protein